MRIVASTAGLTRSNTVDGSHTETVQSDVEQRATSVRTEGRNRNYELVIAK